MSNLKELPQTPDTSSDYELSGYQVGQLRRHATLALDSSVLLNLYLYSEQTREDFLQFLEDLKDRIWLPHQSAYEYERNRVRVIKEQITFSTKLRSLLLGIAEAFVKEVKKIHPRVGREFQSPFLPIEDIQSLLAAMTDQIDGKLKPDQDEYEGFLTDDPIRERLNQITYDRIGNCFSQLDLKKIYDDGLRRYDLQQPPGYLDAAKKQGVEKYGDLIIWRQLINRAKETGDNIYFITDDAKNDWWQKHGKGPDGARHELIDEMEEHTSKRFLISKGGDFYTWAGDHVGRRARKAAIAEARRSAALGRWDWATTMIRSAMDISEAFLPMRDINTAIARMVEDIAAAGKPAKLELASSVEKMLEDLRRSTATAITEPFRLWYEQLEEALFPKDAGSSENEGSARGDAKNDQATEN